MTSQGVKFKDQNTKLKISLVVIGQSTLNLPSSLHPNKYTRRCIVVMATHLVPGLHRPGMIPYYMKFWRHVNLAILKNPFLAAFSFSRFHDLKL